MVKPNPRWLIVIVGIIGLLLQTGSSWAASQTELEKSDPADSRLVVVLDPGHGGEDRGIKIHENLAEKDITQLWAKKCKNELMRNSKIDVLLTHNTDGSLSVLERATLANRKPADLFISFHCAIGDNTHVGRISFFSNQYVEDGELTQMNRRFQTQGSNVIPWEIAQNRYLEQSQAWLMAIKKYWNQEKPSYSILNQLSVTSAPIAVLNGVQCSAFLIELDLPISKNSEKIIDGLIDQSARLVANAIIQYMKKR